MRQRRHRAAEDRADALRHRQTVVVAGAVARAQTADEPVGQIQQRQRRGIGRRHPLQARRKPSSAAEQRRPEPVHQAKSWKGEKNVCDTVSRENVTCTAAVQPKQALRHAKHRVPWKACPIPHQPRQHMLRFQSREKLVPQPQADFALGLCTAKWLPINSSV